MSFEEVLTLVLGRRPTPEELEEHRTHALMVLSEIAFAVTDSDRIWAELDSDT